MRTAILPFLFIFNTQLLLIGLTGPIHTVITIGTAIIAMLVFAAATQGYFLTKTRWWETLALLLVCFTLFRPGFWMDMVYPPFDEVRGQAMQQEIANAPANTGKRIWIEGISLEGNDVRKGVLLPLGAKEGDYRQRLADAGVTVMPDGDELMVVGVRFGSVAEKLGLEQGFRIKAIELPAARPAKEWFFVPALALLALVMWLQVLRMRRGRGAR